AQSSDLRSLRGDARFAARADRAACGVESRRGGGPSRPAQPAAACRGVAGRGGAAAVADMSAADRTGGPPHVGNAEANVRFLDATGAVVPGARILEIGTGTGGMLHTLLDRGVAAQGVEVNASLIAESRRWFGELPITHIAGTALPFAAESFDAVL